MAQPLISVVIPVYNHAHALRRSFFSLFEQTYRPLQVILVDDGSTDNLSQVLEEMQTRIETNDAGFTLKILRQTNQGAPVARNLGFEKVTGEFVIFWDADTVAKPEMLEKFKCELDKHAEASYAYSQFRFGWKKFKSQVFNANDLKKCNYVDMTSLIRVSDLPKVFAARGLFDVSLIKFMDWDVWLTLLERGKKGVFVPQVLYRKIVGLRRGYSSWLPKWAYLFPWASKQIKKYEEAKKIILKKHRL